MELSKNLLFRIECVWFVGAEQGDAFLREITTTHPVGDDALFLSGMETFRRAWTHKRVWSGTAKQFLSHNRFPTGVFRLNYAVWEYDNDVLM